MILVTAGQMQRMDKTTINDFGIPGQVLMENAGKGAFEFLMARFGPDDTTKTAIIAGRGNNGGDGFVIARYLMEKGVPVTMILLSSRDKVAGDARTNMILAQKLLAHRENSSFIEIPDPEALETQRNTLVHQDLFVDAVFGTGLNSPVRGMFKDVIQIMNQSKSPVFSVDIASGLNSNTGAAMGTAVRASATATFAHAKAGHVLFPGNEYTGDLEVIDIGIPEFVTKNEKPDLWLLSASDIVSRFPPRPFDTHKGQTGHCLILAGSRGKTGAAALGANAAVRAGAGLVTLGIPKSLSPVLEPMVVEPMTHPLPETGNACFSAQALDPVMDLSSSRQVLAMGPGMGTDDQTRTLVKDLIRKADLPMVIDADGINCIADGPKILKSKKAPLVLTPHPGEMARLAGTSTARVQANRLDTAKDFAKKHDVILVLKGAQTLIALPDGRTFINPTGNPGMASGGMGDVLFGMITGFAAQGLSLERAALAGVFLHGLGADILAQTQGGFGFTASDLVKTIPLAIRQILPCQD